MGGWRRNPEKAARRFANAEAHFSGQPLRCAWCRRSMTYRESTGDHIIPQCIGGRHWITVGRRNVVAACLRCNQMRSIEAALLVGRISVALGKMRELGITAWRASGSSGEGADT